MDFFCYLCDFKSKDIDKVVEHLKSTEKIKDNDNIKCMGDRNCSSTMKSLSSMKHHSKLHQGVKFWNKPKPEQASTSTASAPVTTKIKLESLRQNIATLFQNLSMNGVTPNVCNFINREMHNLVESIKTIIVDDCSENLLVSLIIYLFLYS